jgi:hypothetical protein
MNGSGLPLHSMEDVVLKLLNEPPVGGPQSIEVGLGSGPSDADLSCGPAAPLCDEDVAVLGEGPKIEPGDGVAIAVGRRH